MPESLPLHVSRRPSNGHSRLVNGDCPSIHPLKRVARFSARDSASPDSPAGNLSLSLAKQFRGKTPTATVLELRLKNGESEFKPHDYLTFSANVLNVVRIEV